MRKLASVGIVLCVVMGAAVAVSWPSLELRLTDNTVYQETDRRQYEYFTPEVLKNIPRISDKYIFDYALVDGSPRTVHAVKFYGTTDVKPVKRYLESLGYRAHAGCDIGNECWKGSNPLETISVEGLNRQAGVIVIVENRIKRDR